MGAQDRQTEVWADKTVRQRSGQTRRADRCVDRHDAQTEEWTAMTDRGVDNQGCGQTRQPTEVWTDRTDRQSSRQKKRTDRRVDRQDGQRCGQTNREVDRQEGETEV